ncbi:MULTISPECIES: toxic anion resistance protein [unclassified Luteococcus]|uniref:toxic anion resistance protein n=1 Tax=unclassified Luteococcus TaxID=2639923 RepID=UPI00313AC0E4
MSIDFGAITGAPTQPAGPAESGVAQLAQQAAQSGSAITNLAPGSQSGGLSCLAMLSPAQQEQARAVATQQLPAMLADTQKLATFGDQALTAVNSQVNRIFQEVGPVQIPELTTIMHQINDRMREFRRHYDPADPRVRETFDRFIDAVHGIFKRGRDLVEMLFEEARSVEQQLDRIAGQLSEKQMQLKRNVVLCDELYKANEASISQLVGVIAVMEAVLEQAHQQADAIVVDPNAADSREKQEERARITEFIMALQTRINEFQQRLFVAWSTSPQIRNIRTLHYGLGQRLALLVNLTIPTMKLTIAQWGLLLQAQQAAGLQQAVADGANEVLGAYASASGRAIPEIARQMQTPTLRPETILEVAASLDSQATGIEEAVRYGEQARQQVVGSIVTAQQAMLASSDRLDKAVSELVSKSQQTVELPTGPELPQAVLEQAPKLATPAS